MSERVWTVLYREDNSVVGVTRTAERGKALAEEDNLGPLTWQERDDGRFTSTTWEYEVRPFEVQP